MGSLSDGASNTLMLSEVRTRGNPLDQRGAWALPWTGSTALAVDVHPLGSGTYGGNPASSGTAQLPNNQGPNLDMLYDCPSPAGAQIQRMPCNTYTPGGGLEFLSAAPRSNHAGGVNAIYADGHVDFIADNIDQFLFAYLVSINDGQTIAPP
jgi:prepilin-type processing-associated H-X9-DG protein